MKPEEYALKVMGMVEKSLEPKKKLKMYEVKITFPFLAESKEDMLQKIRPYLYPHLDENIFDAPEIVREIPPDEAQEFMAVNADEVNVGQRE